MRISGGCRLAFIWLAVVATLMATLAPSIAQALSTSSGGDWASVCSAVDASDAGARTAGTGLPDPPGHLHAFEHCPYCAMHSDLAPPPPPPSLASDATVAFAERPTAFLNAPRRSWIWVAAQPRAPPVAG